MGSPVTLRENYVMSIIPFHAQEITELSLRNETRLFKNFEFSWGIPRFETNCSNALGKTSMFELD